LEIGWSLSDEWTFKIARNQFIGDASMPALRNRWLPWTILVLLAFLLIPSHWVAYLVGQSSGQYYVLSRTIPANLRQSVAILRGDSTCLSQTEVGLLRANLAGSIGLLEGMIIKTEKRNGNLEQVAEFENLLAEGKELEKSLSRSDPRKDSEANDIDEL
jgi:hypothetical protein